MENFYWVLETEIKRCKFPSLDMIYYFMEITILAANYADYFLHLYIDITVNEVGGDLLVS